MEIQNINQKVTGFNDSETIFGLLVTSYGNWVERFEKTPTKHLYKVPEYRDIKRYYSMLYSILSPEYDMGSLPALLDDNILKTIDCYKRIVKAARLAGIYKVGKKRLPVMREM